MFYENFRSNSQNSLLLQVFPMLLHRCPALSRHPATSPLPFVTVVFQCHHPPTLLSVFTKPQQTLILFLYILTRTFVKLQKTDGYRKEANAEVQQMWRCRK